MPSKLVGLRRTLTWSDFQGQPPPGATFVAATSAHVVFDPSPPPIEPTAGGFRLADALTMRIEFRNRLSWVLQLQQELLDHEQGHYDITALVSRDLFIRLMQQKPVVLPSRAAAARNIQDWVNIYLQKINKIQIAYDNDTGHSQANVFVASTNSFTPPHQKGSPQVKWEDLIRRGFSDLRPSGETALDKDDTPYKVEIEDVLLQAGIKL
jgi:hypothetical protein